MIRGITLSLFKSFLANEMSFEFLCSSSNFGPKPSTSWIKKVNKSDDFGWSIEFGELDWFIESGDSDWSIEFGELDWFIESGDSNWSIKFDEL